MQQVRTVRPHARQPGQLIVELRQVHLSHTRHEIADAHLCLCSVYPAAHPEASSGHSGECRAGMHLQLTLLGLCSLRKYVNNKRGPVGDAAGRQLLRRRACACQPTAILFSAYQQPRQEGMPSPGCAADPG